MPSVPTSCRRVFQVPAFQHLDSVLHPHTSPSPSKSRTLSLPQTGQPRYVKVGSAAITTLWIFIVSPYGLFNGIRGVLD